MKHALTIAFISTCLFSFGQSTMFWNNYSNLNPAMSGFNYQQHAAVSYTNFYPALTSTSTDIHANVGTKIADRHGVGINFTGNYSYYLLMNRIVANYNYQFDWEKAGKLSIGTGLGYGRSEYGKDYLTFIDPSSAEPRNSFIATLGAAYAWKNLCVGVSTTNLAISDQNFISPYSVPNVGLNAHLAYKVEIGQKFDITARSLFTSLGGFQNLRVNATATYDERFSLGVSANNRDNYGFNVGWDIKRKFRVGYMFSKTISKLNNSINGGVHEITIGYLLKP